MTELFERLYCMVNQQVSIDPQYVERNKILAKAKLAILNEMGEETQALMEAYDSLDVESQRMREQALFRAGLELGLMLGRITETPG